MGVVWSAVNEAFGREVAIKVMLPGIAASDATALERFFTEARICGGIRDPGIVDVLDVGRDVDGAPYLVMELLDGDSLDTVLHRAGTLRPLEILPVIRDIAKTLGLAPDKGVIHRDLKPGNVFLHRLPSGQAVAKVLDFGVSKVTSAGAPTTRTRTGMVVGSPAYMSPEQAAGRVELDPRSDIYALGVILYEALSGRLPFLEENYNALMIDIASERTSPTRHGHRGSPKAGAGACGRRDDARARGAHPDGGRARTTYRSAAPDPRREHHARGPRSRDAGSWWRGRRSARVSSGANRLRSFVECPAWSEAFFGYVGPAGCRCRRAGPGPVDLVGARWRVHVTRRGVDAARALEYDRDLARLTHAPRGHTTVDLRHGGSQCNLRERPPHAGVIIVVPASAIERGGSVPWAAEAEARAGTTQG